MSPEDLEMADVFKKVVVSALSGTAHTESQYPSAVVDRAFEIAAQVVRRARSHQKPLAVEDDDT